jgi:hypothetical protein
MHCLELLWKESAWYSDEFLAFYSLRVIYVGNSLTITSSPIRRRHSYTSLKRLLF